LAANAPLPGMVVDDHAQLCTIGITVISGRDETLYGRDGIVAGAGDVGDR